MADDEGLMGVCRGMEEKGRGGPHKEGTPSRVLSHCNSENAVGKDKIMSGIKVTKETYEGCKQSFIVADEHHEKASTKYFSDTGTMAAICCHEIPLLYVNVWAPGEQQFYVLSLLANCLSISKTCGQLDAYTTLGIRFIELCTNGTFLHQNGFLV